MPLIDDTNDACIGGNFDWIKGKTRFLSAHEEDVLSDAGSHRVGSHDDAADRLTRRREWLHEQEFHALERFVFERQHDIADYAADLNVIRTRSTIYLDLVDDAHDRRVDGTVFQPGRHSR